MTIRAAIVTSWTTAPALGNCPQLPLDYPVIQWVDITVQPTGNIPTTPNEYTIEAILDSAVFDQIVADGHEVLWSEEI